MGEWKRVDECVAGWVSGCMRVWMRVGGLVSGWIRLEGWMCDYVDRIAER